jgi:hypothetical protein
MSIVYNNRPASMEQIVRPWVPVTSTPKPRVPAPPEEEFPEAFIRWGAASEFATGDSFREDAANPGFHVDDPEEPERLRLTFDEEGRDWTDFRVENPADPEQYAIIRRVNNIAFRGPSGEQYIYNMRNINSSMPGTVEGSGQEPPTPPLDQM